MHSKSITIYSLLFLSYVINVFADFTITPNVNPGGNTIISSHTDSGILFEDLGNGGQGIRLRGWGDGLHWDYGNYIKISSEDADLALKQIEVSYLDGNNLDENSDVADFWFRFSGYDSNGTVTYQEIHYADRIISEEVNEYFTFYTIDWGDQIKTYTFTDEFAGSSYIQVEISYQTLIVIKDVNLMPDSDRDGLNDYDEVNTHSTNPLLADTDSDGLSDGAEVNTYSSNPLLADTDSDGLSDGAEVNTYSSNPLESDSDGDGLLDGVETNAGTDPNNADSDGDGFGDNADGFPNIPTQDIVNEILSNPSVYDLYSRDGIQDLRTNSTILDVSNNQATIQIQMEESSDLESWTETGDPATMTVPADTDTKFFRFKMAE
jgi:hypothetical protein